MADYSLFTDPRIKAKSNDLSDEEKARYNRQGEKFFGNMPSDQEINQKIAVDPEQKGKHYENTKDFQTNKELAKKWDVKTLEPIARLNALLVSGFHPSGFNENEITALEGVYGKEWYLKYGYKTGDLVKTKAKKKSALADDAKKWKAK